MTIRTEDRSGSARRPRAWRVAARLALFVLAAGCSSPFKGDPPPPRESSGWRLDRSNADWPTQEQMDEQDENLGAGEP